MGARMRLAGVHMWVVVICVNVWERTLSHTPICAALSAPTQRFIRVNMNSYVLLRLIME